MANEVTNVSIKAMLSNTNGAWAKELAKVLPSDKEVGRFMSVALGQLADPKVGAALTRCTPASFYNCILKSARSGILPDGVNAYLIPYGTTCQLQYSYRGLCDMAIREGICTKIVADTICENDDYAWSMGEVVRHSYDIRKPRGEFGGCWARAYLKDGSHTDVQLTAEEIKKIRGKAQSDKVWGEWFEEMAKKATVKRLFKMLQNTPSMAEAIASDNEAYDLNKNSSANRTASNTLFSEDEEKKTEESAEVIEAEVVSES